MHYGSKSCLGINLQASLELLVIEMGTSLQPLAEDYDQCHHWVTPSWLKSIWEKAKRFNIKVQFAPLPLEPPRIRDSWIMKDFIQLNYSPQELRQLNRVRMHQQVIFLSDVRDASGRALDKNISTQGLMATNGLRFHFPRKIHLMRTFFYGKKHFSKSEHSGGDSNLALTSG